MIRVFWLFLSLFYMASAALSAQADDIRAMARKRAEAVVRIQTDQGSGTGFFINQYGTVLTCHHVIQGAKTIQVFWKGKRLKAAPIHVDKKYDQALLTVCQKPTPYLTVQKSYFERFPEKKMVKQGDPILVIGHPLNSRPPVVRAGRITRTYYRFDRLPMTDMVENIIYQTDALIQRGNSGSPAFNGRGEVIGVVTAKLKSKNSNKPPRVGFIYAIERFLSQKRLLFQSLLDQEKPLLCQREVSGQGKNPYYFLAQSASGDIQTCQRSEYADVFVGSFLDTPLYYEFRPSFSVPSFPEMEYPQPFIAFLRGIAKTPEIKAAFDGRFGG